MISFGSYVKVPQVPGTISQLSNHGYVTAITPRYCRVAIRYGRRMKGTWEGRIKDVTELETPTQEE